MPTYKYSTGLFLFAMTFDDKLLSVKPVSGRVLRTLQLTGNKIKKDFEATVATWQDPADFNVPKVRFAGGNPRLLVTTKSDKWRWLNYGTSIRWAGMHKDFRPKTKVGKLSSGTGHRPYEPVWRGKSHMVQKKSGDTVQVQHSPRPGIEARDWTGTAKKKYRERLKADLRRAIREGLASP